MCDCLSYINIIATFIAVCTTFVVGFHIINGVALNKKLRRIEKTQKETERQIVIQRNVTNESISIANGLEIWKNNENPLTRGSMAFLEFHHALIFSIEIEREDYDWLFGYLDKCIKALTYNDFQERGVVDGNQQQRVKAGILEFIKLVDEDASKIKRSKNYYRIKYQYEAMRKNLSEELGKIVSM
jgi:hypothetical protein